MQKCDVFYEDALMVAPFISLEQYAGCKPSRTTTILKATALNSMFRLATQSLPIWQTKSPKPCGRCSTTYKSDYATVLRPNNFSWTGYFKRQV
jgi:hypothetical protein